MIKPADMNQKQRTQTQAIIQTQYAIMIKYETVKL